MYYAIIIALLAACGSKHAGNGTSNAAKSTSQGNESTPTNLKTSVAPGGNFDLSLWKLQLPIGTNPHHIEEIHQSDLEGPDGFHNAYFYTDQTDGAMTFMDPPTGITTGGSKHLRSELREVTNWSPSGNNILSDSIKVNAAAFRQDFNPPFTACFLFWRLGLRLCYHGAKDTPSLVIVWCFNHLTRFASCPVFFAKKLITFCDRQTLISRSFFNFLSGYFPNSCSIKLPVSLINH
ncbi:polysaccharide lyase family 7 protein [Paenibacillus filicis]|uniref:Polysaccharide lyase family 7 protein n=1 Tax=Paenibacillus gyeongsangnamensis TaxID=3388067 RepID=A0ABT4QLP5_9BACL|nr:polysaccharide lyase family 7 protein [Paenibacillus filicis]MCZ8517794.1 polysaccharide lyase family 7 protein [Paenibacillus filicis]